MSWRPYGECCHVRAQDREARICADCGRPLLRCRGFEDCHQILAPHEHCPVHLAPRLFLRRGAILDARAGERLSLPLLLENPGTALGLLDIRGVQAIEGRDAPEAIEIGRGRLAPGETSKLTVDTKPLEAGAHRLLRVVFELAADVGGLEESYALETDIGLSVRGDDASVNQVINISGSGNKLIQTGPNIDRSWEPEVEARGEDSLLQLQRADRFEISRAIRGYGDPGLRILPDVELHWQGFQKTEVPSADPSRPFLHQDRLRLGRNGLRHEPRPGEARNDVCLRVRDANSGEVLHEPSRRISGTHLELALHNDRLVLRARGRFGTYLNDRRLEAGEQAIVQDGDLISPVEPPRRSGLRLLARFVGEDDQIRVIRFTRS